MPRQPSRLLPTGVPDLRRRVLCRAAAGHVLPGGVPAAGLSAAAEDATVIVLHGGAASSVRKSVAGYGSTETTEEGLVMVAFAKQVESRQEANIGGYDPRKMSPDERLDELAGLLAVGLLRMRRQAGEKSRFLRDFSLPKCARKRPHGAELIGGR